MHQPGRAVRLAEAAAPQGYSLPGGVVSRES